MNPQLLAAYKEARRHSSARNAMALAWPSADCGRWFAESDGREDYRTGAVELRAIHPPVNISAASYGRLRRLLGAR